MRSGTIIALAAAAAMFAGVVYFAARGQDDGATAAPAATDERSAAAPVATATARGPASPAAGANAAPADSRLEVFRLSPDDGEVEFIALPDGRVIREVGRNPASPGFGKTLREYSYVGDRVVALATYQYEDGQVRIRRILVSYHPDGSVNQYRETSEIHKP